MATYHLDGDQEYMTVILWGKDYSLWQFDDSTKQDIKARIKWISRSNTRTERLSIAKILVSKYNQEYISDSEVTDAELVKFALLVGNMIWG